MLIVDKETFDAEVLDSKGVTLVDFWSESCANCLELMPKVEALEKTYSDKVKFCKFDIKAGRRLAISQKVMGLPSILLYVDGEKKEHLTGEHLSAEEIEKEIKKYI